jgi:hypothetical protein
VSIPRRGSGEAWPGDSEKTFCVEDIENFTHTGHRANFDLVDDPLADMLEMPNSLRIAIESR